jgi:hypothetical protein
MTKYEKNLKKSIPIPIDFKIDLKNVNFEDPKHKARAEYLENVFTDIKKKSIYQTQWKVKFIEGSEIAPITEKDLNKDLKQRVELGFITMEEAFDTVRKNKVGDRVKEIKLIMPIGEESKVETDYTEEDFVVPELPDASDVKQKVEEVKETNKQEEKQSVEDQFTSLFGGDD